MFIRERASHTPSRLMPSNNRIQRRLPTLLPLIHPRRSLRVLETG
jgi:hypothetical protein